MLFSKASYSNVAFGNLAIEGTFSTSAIGAVFADVYCSIFSELVNVHVKLFVY